MRLSVCLIHGTALTTIKCLEQKWKTTLINRYKEENTELESHKHKLITEFTPSTGLRLWVPLQWEPIQLKDLKWYKWFWTPQITFSSMDKSLQDLFSGIIQIGFQKQRKTS